MKLQYRYYEHIGFKYAVQLYCDGKLTKSYKVYSIDLDDEIDKLEGQGYVYGYTEEEVNKAKARYERMLDNIILEDKCDHNWEFMDVSYDSFYTVRKYKCSKCGAETSSSLSI